MRSREMRGRARLLCLAPLLCLLLVLLNVSPAMSAERPPYEFDAQLSLTGSCTTSKQDPLADPGCPEKKPAKPFTKLTAIGIDSFGDEYVASWGAEEGKQGRIDVFSPEGVFITEVKDGAGPKNVAVDSKGVLYTFDQRPGDSAEFARYKPKAYEPAKEEIEYGERELIAEGGGFEGGLAIDGNDHVFVDWPSLGIKEYSSAAEGNELKTTISNERLKFSTFIALDKQRRRLYASSCPTGDITKCWILVLNADAPHELLKEVKGPNPSEEGFLSQKGWISVAVNEETGDFFVGDLEQTKNVYQFNKDYELVSTLAQNPELFEGGEPLQIAVSNAKDAANHEYLFVPSIKSPNRALAYHPPEEVEPEIESVFVTGIGETEAELQAQINPGGGKTHYVFEYLSQAEYEEAGNSFVGAKVAGEGTILPSEQEALVKAAIGGLSSGTAYRFRVVAENEVEEVEGEATFATYDDASIVKECPEALRNGYSSLLPDCRVYELVTPPDTNGRVPTGLIAAGDVFPGVKASPSGNAVSFFTRGGSLPGFNGAGALNGERYRTLRTASGWSTELAVPSGAASTLPDPGGVSPDQGYAFWEAVGEGSAVIEGKETRYVRYPDGHLALVGRGSLGTDPQARGKLITENGTHIIFETHPVNGSDQPIQLEPAAPPTGTRAVYDRTPDETTHVVSIRPDGEPFAAGDDAAYVGASANGEGIAFSVGGTLYLRVNNSATYEIGTGVEFAGVAEEGKRIFYVKGGDLFAFDVETGAPVRFTEVGNAVPVNVAPDGTRAYFVSTTAIVGSGENPNGASAQAGEENLYLSEEGTIRFVGTVTERDVKGGENANGAEVDGLGLWVLALKNRQPAIDPTRLDPTGTVLLFTSRANLDGYAHEKAPEIYRYDSVGNRLHCLSCIPTKTPATGGASLESYLLNLEAPAPFNESGFVQNLRADGKRALFESTEALISSDTDGVQDVYEWEEEGVGSCTRAGGCIYLISSGHSAKNNYLYGTSASGDDVFFTTSDILFGGDNDTLSIYDARVNGGFPEAVEEKCKGEGCKPDLTPAPPLPPPVTGATGPSGSLPVACPKGKHRATRHDKQVCVKNKRRHHKHRRAHKAKKGAGK